MSASRILAGAAAVTAAAILVFGWLLGVSPHLAEAGRLDEQRVAVETQNQVQQAALVALAEDFRRRDEVFAALESRQTAVPVAPELEDFLTAVGAAAASAGVTVAGFSSSEAVAYTDAAPVAADSAAGAPAPAASGAPAAEAPGGTAVIPDASTLGLYYIPVTVQVGGGPDQLVAFVRALQEGPRLFISPTFAITAAQSGGQPTASLTGYLFALPDTPAATPAAPAATTDPATTTG